MGSAQAGIALRGSRTPVRTCDLRDIPAGAYHSVRAHRRLPVPGAGGGAGIAVASLHQERVARGRCRGPALLGCARQARALGRRDDREPPLRTSHLRCRDPGAGIAPLLGTLAIEGRTHARCTDSAARVHPARLPTLRLVDGRILTALGRSASRLLVPAGRGRNGCAASALRQACLGDATAARRRPDVPAGGHVLLGLPRRRVGRRRGRFCARATAGASALRRRGRRRGYRVSRLQARHPADWRGRHRRLSRYPHGRRLRQGRVVLALGSLRVAEPLRHYVVRLAGSSGRRGLRRGHRALAPAPSVATPALHRARASSCSRSPSCRTSWSRRPTNSRSTERWYRSRR